MRPQAAIWHFRPQRPSEGQSGDVPVAVLEVYSVPGQAWGQNIAAVVMDETRLMRAVHASETRVVDEEAHAAIVRAKEMLAKSTA